MAVEGGFRTGTGAFFNDFPDRISDSLILVSCGFAAGVGAIGISFGWACALVAAFTAYIRIFGAASGSSQDYGGPMAKPHRMLIVIIACAAAVFENPMFATFNSIFIALVIILMGGTYTCMLRASRLLNYLKHAE
jgi:hypothetical protein